MARPRLFNVYTVSVAVAGLGFAILLTVLQAPHELHSWQADALARAARLLVLTFLSSVSRVNTRTGAPVNVGMPPMFGALLLLPPSAMARVTATATSGER